MASRSTRPVRAARAAVSAVSAGGAGGDGSARLLAFLATPLGKGLLKTALAAAVFLALGVVVRQARAQAYGIPAYRLGPASIVFADLPTWVDEPILHALRDPRRLRVSVSVFDPGAEDHVRDVLSHHPMVRDVTSVRITYPDRVTVRVRLRVPVARVAAPDGGEAAHELLSDDRRVLDPVPYRGFLARVRLPLPSVVGIRARAPGLGEAWEDREEQVAEALEACRVATRPYRDLSGRVVVRRIDVSRFPARPEERAQGEIRLELADGRVVEWGRTERDAAEGGEDPYEVKVRRLEAHYTDDALKSRKRIEVRYRMRFEGQARLP